MKEMKTRRVLGVAIAMMVLLAVSAVPAMACPCEEGDNVVGNPVVGDLTELTGKEKSKILDMALESDRVKELQKQLVDEGFTQKDPEAFTVPIETEDGLRTEVLVAAIPYENDKSEVKTVAYFHDPQTGESTTIVIRGSLTACVIALGGCLGYIGGCLAVCLSIVVPEPGEPIEVAACLGCIKNYAGIAACVTAYCTCTDYFCDEGNQWACDHRCL